MTKSSPNTRSRSTTGRPIEIGLAILVKKNQIWIQRREGTDHLNGFWEFPGGKVEPGEGVVDALARESLEETGCRIKKNRIRLVRSELFQYPDRLVRLHFFLCPTSDEPDAMRIKGHWVNPHELKRFRMPPANRGIIEWLGANFECQADAPAIIES